MKKDQPFVEPAADARVCTIALLRHGGSHLIRPIVADLGFDIVEPGNFNAPIDKAFGPVIVFPREPRDRMASMLRFNLRKSAKRRLIVANGKEPDRMMATLLQSEPFIGEMLNWARIWMPRSDALRVNYEELATRSTAAVHRISNFLGLNVDLGRDEGVLSRHFERSTTFVGSHSRWQDWFGAESLAIWKRDGGDELMQIMGYEQ